MSLADFLWGKTNDGDRSAREGKHLSVLDHLLDTGDLASLLWDEWMSPAMKRGISGSLASDEARHWYILSSALHDIGKLTPLFYEGKSKRGKVAKLLGERMAKEGYPLGGLPAGTSRHEIATGIIVAKFLRELGWERHDIEAYVIPMMSHHGFTPSKDEARGIHGVVAPSKRRYEDEGGSLYVRLGWNHAAWVDAQRDTWNRIVSKYGKPRPVGASPISQSRMIAAITIADWAASRDADLLTGSSDRKPDRIVKSWRKLNLPGHWEPSTEPNDLSLYRARFGEDRSPRDTQVVAAQVARSLPVGGSISVIESPPGEGKTQAALLAGEIQAAQGGRCGLTFALPTRMTTDSMWKTIREWTKKLDVPDGASVFLGHSNSDLNADYQSLNGEDGDLRKVELFSRQMGLFASFSVETVDQLLPAAKRNAYTHLRNLALSDKVVVVDEVHSYSDFTSEFLYAMLRNLGAQGVPVILLSATLSPDTRMRLISSYAGTDQVDIPERVAYPSITSWDALNGVQTRDVRAEVSKKHLSISVVGDSIDRPVDLPKELRSLLREGGCIAIVRSTVARAQETYHELAAHFPNDVVLLHSRLTARDRSAIEDRIVKNLGEGGDRPERMIVVATQVIEQSLDIDFDLIFSDPAPYDQIIQRSGRNHRHDIGVRPTALSHPRVIVLKDLTAHHGVYPDYLIYSSLNVLEGKSISGVSIPEDIASDIRFVYDPDVAKLSNSQASHHGKWTEDKLLRSGRAAERTADLTGGSLIGVNIRNDEFSDHSSDIRGEIMFEAILCYGGRDSYQPVGSAKKYGRGSSISDEDGKDISLSRVQLPRSAARKASEGRRSLDAKRPRGWKGVLSFATPIFADHDGIFDLFGERFTYSSVLGIEKKDDEETE